MIVRVFFSGETSVVSFINCLDKYFFSVRLVITLAASWPD